MAGSILVVFAFVLACCAALNVSSNRVSLGWPSLAFYFASILFGTFGNLIH